jgi:prepilin-type N-terminal cleavage/methylation domain-containing protein
MFQFFSKRLRNDRGFTLIELLIVVAIIAILAAILIPNFLRARAQSQISASKGNMKNFGTALESYFVDSGQYPDALADLEPNYIRDVTAANVDPCSNSAYSYTTVGTPPTDYTLATPDWTGTQCANILSGLSYTPGGGLSESP